VLTTIFFIMCLLGAVVSLYFTSVYLGMPLPVLKSLANACRMDTSQCQRVLDTAESHLFGLPNFVLGLLYYLVLMLAYVFSFPFQAILIIVAWGVVILSLYLAFQLYFVLKMSCPLCYLSHVLNICIAFILSFI